MSARDKEPEWWAEARRLRAEKGMTSKEIANVCGVKYPAVNRVLKIEQYREAQARALVRKARNGSQEAAAALARMKLKAPYDPNVDPIPEVIRRMRGARQQ